MIKKKSVLKSILLVAVLCLVAMAGWVGYNWWFECGRHTEKLWLHRCVTMEKLRATRKDYPNIEVDVVFWHHSGLFDVSHDVDNASYLPLDSIFSYMSGQEGRMWLDVKNLNARNRLAMLRGLNALCQRYGIAKDRLIVESPQWQQLRAFTDAGYYTSMYVPFAYEHDMTPAQVDSCIAILQAVADRGAVRALSFPGRWYATLKRKLHRSIDLLTWRNHWTQLQLLCRPSGRRMLADPQLKVILVKEEED